MKSIWNYSGISHANPLRCWLFIAAAALVLGCSAQAQQTTNTSAGSDVARGKYLVESVAMCVQCHTPRNADGTLHRSRLLQGAPVIWQSADPDPNWPLNAPRIGGTLPASDADMIKLLTTGIWTDGKPLRLPMMPFRMNESDAKAVIAYLKSVTPEK
jgi:mono/diheme cytochrome c family protein